MGDERIRALERDPEERARLVGERLRRGELSRERVELAAAFLDPSALAVTPKASLVHLKGPDPSGPLAIRFDGAGWEAIGAEAPARLGWALATLELRPKGRVPDEACLRVCEDWILEPTSERYRAVATYEDRDVWEDERPSTLAVGPIVVPGDLLGQLLEGYVQRVLARRLKRARRKGELSNTQEVELGRALLADLGRTIAPWALGEGDPVRTRVAEDGRG